MLSAWARGSQGKTIRPEDIGDFDPRHTTFVFYGVDEVTQKAFRVIRDRADWLYIDNGYLRSKYDVDGERYSGPSYFRITRNARQIPGTGDADPARFERLGIRFAPWRRDGEHVVVAAQSRWWYQQRGMDKGRWIEETVAALRQHTDRPIVVRDKPVRGQKGVEPIESVLAGAWCVVTLDSNVAIDGIVRGIPAICLAPCAARAVAGDNLAQVENPPTPRQRRRWGRVLAANQWTLGEIGKGIARHDLEIMGGSHAKENRSYTAA